MPIRIPTKGHDPVVDYTVKEIADMYICEGCENVKKRAKVIYREIRKLNISEQRLWIKVREHEFPNSEITLLIGG